ncbi:hypothetical protein COJ85_32450 [Bacillus sp. AFS076308]|uniref:hypothetical protein n=1 Tax=unclassified Bacillus (in: firmicutes) TaxID=185979 RepID=UPI000BFA7525|nr:MULTISPECIES: hypothetical protein [unclassified Bacillus (in: firmicutes)]PFN76541.1 hypothetical protein COJ85_32450 [Bacillus sp. AFS076308]PGV54752.1 hypothetical protein COD92_03265 [Bacillus sp. AFS037270]
MVGLIIATVIFNLIALKIKKRISLNLMHHIWVFTIAFQTVFDVFVDFKYHGYWYFSKNIDWQAALALFLVPPVNIVFLNYFPYKKTFMKKILYITGWEIVLLLYEVIALLPAPWGYFHYGWWTLWHSLVINPILLMILLGYYKWIVKLEKRSTVSSDIKY